MPHPGRAVSPFFGVTTRRYAAHEMPEEDGPFEAPVVLPIEPEIDLHPFAPRDVRAVVDAYLEEAARAGLREVRLIHGRGVGAQRASVQALLARHPEVERFADAPPDRGGWGATLVWLRPRPAPE
jgi:DNA-nicking Smr family endonuclease